MTDLESFVKNEVQETNSQDKQKPALVLDLDETIVRATRMKTKNPDQKRILVNKKRFYVQPRPGLNQFLDDMKEIFDIYFFTASEKDYADSIIHTVAPFVPDSHRFYRDSITNDCGVNVKDLTKIGKPLTKVILIDNSQSSGLYQPENVIVINSWFGDANDDCLINELEPLLIEATCESNLIFGAVKAMNAQKPNNIFML